jgi:hypothetical protein
MPECSYCGESFETEGAELEHLQEVHAGELSRIDQRRVGDIDEGDGGLPLGPIILAGVILFALAVVVYVTVFVGGGGGPSGTDEPGPYRSAHQHGTIEMTVLGERVDFGQDRYQIAADRFHFENNDGEVWHTHATGVTLKWAMDTLPGIEVTDDNVTYRGTTYADSDPDYEVIVEVNGESVDPAEYVLQGVGDAARASEGDAVRIVVRRTEGSG